VNNNYISKNDCFSFTLANTWIEYDDEDDSTYAFWHETEPTWTGNFRITAFQLPDAASPETDQAGDYIATEIAENANAQSIKLGNNHCAHYKKESLKGGEGIITYYWITGKNNDLFLCTFTIDKTQEFLPINETELTTVRNMIASIQII